MKLSYVLLILAIISQLHAHPPEAETEIQPDAEAIFETGALPEMETTALAAARRRTDPTERNVSYGSHKHQVLHFWQAESSTPTPLVFYIHGGGWKNGSKNAVYHNGLEAYLDAGISVVSIQYRFLPAAAKAGVEPPVAWPLEDAARALQFVRSKAGEWNVDKTRIAASGSSAGGCSSLWLAFHPDMADPASPDPVARESTRLYCAAVIRAQTTLDPEQMKEWIPNSIYGGPAFGFKTFQGFLEHRDSILPWIWEYSPYHLLSSDDPPVYLCYGRSPNGSPDPTHHYNFGIGLQQKMDNLGIPCELRYPRTADSPGLKEEVRQMIDYVIITLKTP